MSRRRQPIGFRREVLIVLPVALLVLLIVSAFTLLSYHSAISSLQDQRGREATELAAHVAETIAGSPSPANSNRLRQAAPGALVVALVDSAGRIVVVHPTANAPHFAGPIGGGEVRQAMVLDSDPGRPGSLAAVAPLELAGERLLAYVELPNDRLASQAKTVRILAAVVLGVGSAVALLLLIFVNRILRPYEALLQRARSAGGPHTVDEDEVEFLVATFERALASLSAPTDDADTDLTQVQEVLSASLGSGVLLIDRHGRLLAVNDSGRQLLACSPPTGEDYREALDAHPELVATLTEAVAGERSVERRELNILAGHRPRTLGLTVHPLRRDDQRIRGYLGLFVDITEARKQAEDERLAGSLSALGELTAGIAHELRNSLATLKGYLTLVERHPDEESITDYLAEIRQESDQLQRILEDFLSFAQPGTVRTRTVNLMPIVRRAMSDPVLDGAPVELVAEAEPGDTLQGDPELLERALRNLIHNAVASQATTSPEVAVEISLGRDDAGLFLNIDDRGHGILPEIEDRLFQPFVTTRPGGVGLGLALAYRIVDLHGGRLRLENRPGGGARASILFPTDRIDTKGNNA